ncbi:peptide-methionine (R)-S-oxide reductase [Maudiozyma humilis]|uniref:Peptide-methionine (R)-S-oxide reductase n=1 Tax=Maudiozyma humilis TaxID=51915 RepID=A0AAV5S0P1_MAUHU|nr:peptide-methionine (R)-S-oxide reductase [Kazachstania humilis]
MSRLALLRSLSLFRPLHSLKPAMSTWNPKLSPDQLHVLRDKGTERPGTGAYLANKALGVYHCANCDAPLYRSDAKFDSGCGWPSFYEEVAPGALKYTVDNSLGMERTEVTCAKCGGHMGHVFKGEGWDKRLGIASDARHCVNSLSLNFKPGESS